MKPGAARVLGEALLIVVSILLAFAIDAWWDGRNDRVEEQRILRALASDFAATRATVIETTGRYEQARDSTMRLLGLLSGNLSDISDTELFRLVRWSFGAWSFEPRLPTYHEIVSSGSLGLIRSDELRGQMATVVDELEDGQDYYRELFRRSTLLEDPFLVEHTPGYAVWQGKGGLTFPELPFPWSREELRTRDFASLLGYRQAWTVDVVTIGHQLVREIDTTLELIDDARGGGG